MPGSRALALILANHPSAQFPLTRAAELAGCVPLVSASETAAYALLSEYSDQIAAVVIDAEDVDAPAFRRLQLKAPSCAGIPTVIVADAAAFASNRNLQHLGATLEKPVDPETLGRVLGDVLP